MKRLVVLIITHMLQAVASMCFMLCVIKLDILPTKYVVSICVALSIAFIATFFLQRSKSWKYITGIVLSLLLSMGMIGGTIAVEKINHTMEELTTPDEYYDHVVIAVKADSNYNTIQEMKNCTFGVQYTLQKDLTAAAIDELESELECQLNVKEYDTVAEQINALLDGSVDAVIYNSVYADLLNETIESYNNQVKIIFEYKFKQNDIENIQNENETQEVVPPNQSETTTTQEPDNNKNEIEVDKTDDVFAIYFSGIDVYGSISKNSRSDVNILAIVNPAENKVLLINTPRDIYVKIPGVSGDKKDKLTHAGIYGVNASMKAIGKLYGVDVQYYFKVNFTSFEKIINALGGITVHSEYNFSVGEFKYHKGSNDLNGAEALAFARERKSFSGGDRQRGIHQQEVIKAVIKKACSPAILTSANSILNSVKSGIDTNIPESLIQKMIKKQLDDGKEWKIETMSLDGTGTYGETYSMPGFELYVMEPNEGTVQKIKKAISAMYQ